MPWPGYTASGHVRSWSSISTACPGAAGVLGEQACSGTSVELVAVPEGRTGTGGAVSE